MADKMEKIAPIPSVQFSSKSNGYKLRSVGFNISFYCHDDVFVAICRDSVAIRRNCSAKNLIFCSRRDSKKLEINSYLRHCRRYDPATWDPTRSQLEGFMVGFPYF